MDWSNISRLPEDKRINDRRDCVFGGDAGSNFLSERLDKTDRIRALSANPRYNVVNSRMDKTFDNPNHNTAYLVEMRKQVSSFNNKSNVKNKSPLNI